MIAEFTVVQVLLTAAVVYAAFVVRGMSGFGTSLVAMPLLAFVLPIRTAVPLMGLLVFVLFVFLTIRDRRDVLWGEIRLLLVPTLVGVAAGLVLFSRLDSGLLLKCLGGVSVAYAVYALAVHYIGMPPARCGERWAWPAGFAGSFVDTMFGGGGGTIVVMYMHLRGVGKVPFRATVAMLWFFEMMARIAGYAASGYYTAGVLLLAALLLPMMWFGTWCGEQVHHRISQETFSRMLAVMIMASGIALLFK
jgi:uncharacterized membrane protein YfcA